MSMNYQSIGNNNEASIAMLGLDRMKQPYHAHAQRGLGEVMFTTHIISSEHVNCSGQQSRGPLISKGAYH
ncbi:hypothetical protein PABG_11090 [Paracoccidioides brasiliensis Pb03]|uniref:Uncharacterized protein n=2 Tax=Paracoccidioides brasiliensis TaxID=121759 RepID=C1G667_PARBD|nr:uncharacterized protein PADG_02672 [Paracoccidioides brasiliensis Pb18]EEH46574.2 hypothetical protein PADG_02672 [Paracoccidioides brasiliensis Pb18]KGY15851.1 hypothetical protein PABG_11090 [Paracoccidioides brasiliensis Pb03]ODH14486.1 hypothetical protein ACO22_06570 [Paracoccidioides brasiliensis]ODH51080.1 hypothetical protein GX48_02692 [Paracoccidioides brasiliensis]